MKPNPFDSKAAKVRAEQFIREVLHSFTAAYLLHMKGETEEGLLITHDIFAANAGTSKVIAKAHRRAIQSAVLACDEKLPLNEARAGVENELRRQLQALINEAQKPGNN
jgi:hypothetical protein